MAALWDFGVRDPKEAGGGSGEDEDDDEEGEDGDAEEFTLDEVLRLGGTKVRGDGGREREHMAAGSPRNGLWGWRGEPLGVRGLARDPL